MNQHAAQQRWARYDDQTQLAHHAQVFPKAPVFYGLASLKRTKCMWLLRTERPVGGSPISEPLWVPLTVKRPATTSPSPTSSSISKCRSGKALRAQASAPRTDSRTPTQHYHRAWHMHATP